MASVVALSIVSPRTRVDTEVFTRRRRWLVAPAEALAYLFASAWLWGRKGIDESGKDAMIKQEAVLNVPTITEGVRRGRGRWW